MSKLLTRRIHTVMGVLLALVLLPVAAFAQDALQRIPENALGFALIRNLTKTSEKLERLMEPFEIAFPAPLTFAKIITGLDTGLDLSGDLVVALLPGEGTQSPVEPMVLLPISNYAKFAASLHGDTSGEICRVTLLGEDILIAQDGPFAMLMNVEHRGTMEELVGLAAEPLTALNPLAERIRKQDVTLVLMPQGFESLSQQKLIPNRRIGRKYGFSGKRSSLSHLLSAVSGPETCSWMQTHMRIAALGVTVDDQSNVRLVQQFILQESSPFAKLVPESIPPETAKLGLSDKPYVFAAGGPIAAGWGKRFATFLRLSEQEAAAENGLENLSTELWRKEERAYQLLFEDLRSCSVVMLTGEMGEPLVGNFLGVATVPNVSKYFNSLPQAIETWNELAQQSTSDLKPGFELTTERIAGKQHCEMLVDYGSTMRDPNVPVINWMLEAAFGPGGKLHFRLAEVNPTTVVFGLATQEQMAELLKTEQKSATVAPRSPEMLATLDLLKPTSQWKALISPQGCLRWASRAYLEFWALLNNDEIEIPDFPNSPPLGLTVDWNQQRWECELVCPAATWETIGKYLVKVSGR